jgi:hypothetical protein
MSQGAIVPGAKVRETDSKDTIVAAVKETFAF